MEFKAFLDVYAGMFELYKRNNMQMPSNAAIKMFYETVKHIDDKDFKKASIEIMKKSKWMPTPSEILEIAEAERKVEPPAEYLMIKIHGEKWREKLDMPDKSEKKRLSWI